MGHADSCKCLGNAAPQFQSSLEDIVAHLPNKLSTDPNLAAKIEDIVGLYVDPLVRAVVLSLDEKSHVWMAPGSQEKS